MISLIYIKVRTYLIDLKFRIKQMEDIGSLILNKYEVFLSKRWYVIVKRMKVKLAILQFQQSQQISVLLFDTLLLVT